MDVRIVGHDLPGARFDDGGRSGNLYESVAVGVQRGGEIEQLVPATAPEAVFSLTLDPVPGGDGAGLPDARGPYAQGRPGGRFLYLSWVAGPDREMFRRAKLWLRDVPVSVWAGAQEPGRSLEGRLGLSDRCGEPLCGGLAPDVVTWAVAG